jgi:hypothetical protein
MLSAYCGYIGLLALNGVTEAFISAVIDVQQLAHQSRWLVYTMSDHFHGLDPSTHLSWCYVHRWCSQCYISYCVRYYHHMVVLVY